MLRTDRLIALRKSHKLTQAEVAEKLNTSRTNYVRYEKGNHQPPNEVLGMMAELFDVSTDYLLGKTDIFAPPNAKKEAPSEEEARLFLEDALRKNGQLNEDEHITMEQYRLFIKSFKYWENIRKDSM